MAKKVVIELTPFEIAQQQVRDKELATPSVSAGGKKIDYFGYQLAVHKFNLGVMASGMIFKGIKFKDIKWYYGLKGRSAKDCIVQFDEIFEQYKKNFALNQTLIHN